MPVTTPGAFEQGPVFRTYSNPGLLKPFYYARVMAGSVFNLQGDIPTSTAIAYNEWSVDATATLNLQASTATVGESLTTNNFRNYGTTKSIASGANAKVLTVNNLLNAGLFQVLGAGSKITGLGTTPTINNVSTGIINFIGSSATAIIQNINLFVNSGNVTNTGRLLNITTINNNAGGVFTFDGGIYDTITNINNAENAIMNFNNATSANNANLVLSNSGDVNFQAGDFGALNITNDGTII